MGPEGKAGLWDDKDCNLIPGIRSGGRSDNGPGIPSELQPRIFEPYFTTKEQGKGTGLGLAVVNGIVRGCGGAITMESQAGQGTTFQVRLPIVEQREETAAVSPPARLAMEGWRVMLVDDEPLLVAATRKMLERLGLTVMPFIDSLEAMRAFLDAPHEVDLVISDQTMPGMSGIELVREIRKFRPNLPTVICTGFNNINGAKKISDLEQISILSKPFTTRELVQAISRSLASDDRWRADLLCKN